jgi:hypothetical protein
MSVCGNISSVTVQRSGRTVGYSGDFAGKKQYAAKLYCIPVIRSVSVSDTGYGDLSPELFQDYERVHKSVLCTSVLNYVSKRAIEKAKHTYQGTVPCPANNGKYPLAVFNCRNKRVFPVIKPCHI